MAGKKTGKRLLTWVLVLVMALSLLPLNALAAGGPETDGGSGMDFKKELLPNQPDGDGNYTIRMTAQATGTTTTKVEPMDIVLVLDQSGSMGDEFGDGTRQSAMKEAVNSFIGEVADKYSTDADHRMAIVTFGYDAAELVGWTAVDTAGATELTRSISNLPPKPEGATNVGAGMQMAKNLMNDAYTGNNTDRQKTVIVFTDGVPTKQRDFDTTVADAAIDAAKSMKNSGVTIYTVGIFNGAKPTQLHGDKWNYEIFEDVVCDGSVGSCWGGSWLSDLFGSNDFDSIDVPAGNRFLNYLSSNSKNASEVGITKGTYHPRHTGIAGGTGWRIDKNADWRNQSYYMTASDASSLEKIFEGISSTVPAPVNDKLDEKTVITDTLSDYFTFAGTEEDVKVSAIDANGNKKVSEDAAKVKPVVTGKTVTVTGYDFSAHYKGIGGVAEETLVIEIKVKPDSSYTNWGTSGKYDTNKGNATVTHPNIKEPIAEAASPKVYVETYQVTYGFDGDAPRDVERPVDTRYYISGQTADVKPPEPSSIELDGHTYTFNGWKNGEADVDETITISGNVELTGTWTKTANEYTVTYELTNDVKPTKYSVPIDNNKYTKDEEYTVDPTHKENDKVVDGGYTYTFSGWKLNGTGDVLTGNHTMGIGNVVLKGTWTKTVNKYNVTYEYTGTAPADAPDVPAAAQHEYGAEVTIKNVPTLTGYTFHGWTLPEGLNENDGKFTMPAENVTITGYWTKNTIPTYKFDLNDPDTITVNKEFKSKYGLGSARRSFTFTATATIEKQDDPTVNVGPDFPYNPSTNNRSAANVEPTYYEATGTVTLEAGTTEAFKFDKTFKLEPGAYRITVKETNSGDRYVTYDTKPYTRYFMVSEDGVISAIESITITNEYTKRHTAATPSKPTLNTGDHYAYVMGYPDGTVRPNGSITRAEVSAILFRLLSDKTRDEYFTTESSFTDVKAGAWYNNSIATLEKAGVIVDTAKGGAFRPNEAITRAELAAMLAQFSDAKPVKGVKFSDVPAEHWAYEAIAIAAKMGWIEGYPDGKFRPDATITRAEMMTLVNRALERVPSDEDHLLSKRVMLTFPDCKSGDWFYIAVQEATNSHTYERAATEKNGDEQWTALRANRDWTQLEK